MEQITEREINQAVATLSRSERGRQAMSDILALLDHGATSLDESGQVAVFGLVAAGFGPNVGCAIVSMRDSLIKYNEGK